MKKYKCKRCNTRFDNVLDLANHVRITHKRKQWLKSLHRNSDSVKKPNLSAIEVQSKHADDYKKIVVICPCCSTLIKIETAKLT